jgi:ABC-type phosphate transport system permease subunit
MLAMAGRVIGETSSGLAYGVLNSSIGMSVVLVPYVAAWMYTARSHLPFVLSAGMIAVKMVASVGFLRADTR